VWDTLGHLPRTASGNLKQTAASTTLLVAQLAETYGRTTGAIISRLKHLHNPEHVACKRREAHQRLNSPSPRGAVTQHYSPSPSPRQLPSYPSPVSSFSGGQAAGVNPQLRAALKVIVTDYNLTVVNTVRQQSTSLYDS